jgi:hypothetical protein
LNSPFTKDLVEGGVIDPPSSNGLVGEEKWFLPKFTAEKDPSLMSYHGLMGLENWKKLVEQFLHPTTWADYCNEVSDDGCSSGVGPAQRHPKRQKYFPPMACASAISARLKTTIEPHRLRRALVTFWTFRMVGRDSLSNSPIISI